MKTTLIASMALALLVGTANTWADEGARLERNKVSLFYGEVAGEPGVEGHLGSCSGSAPTPFLPDRLVLRSTYQRLASVCDDQLTFNISAASFPTGPVNVAYVKARVRICYDETGAGYCNAVDEVARGWAVSQITGNFFINPNDTVPSDYTSTSFDEEHITHSERFELDGKIARVPRRAHRGNGTGRVSLSCIINNNCPFVGNLAEPLVNRFEGLEEQLAGMNLDQWNYAYRGVDSGIWEANWKSAYENAIEGYHLFKVHPETVEPNSIVQLQIRNNNLVFAG